MANKRLSQTTTDNWGEIQLPTSITPFEEDAEDWLTTWKTVLARDLIDSRIVSVDAETSVEDACDLLLAESIPCLAVKSLDSRHNPSIPYLGLFDYADVNAFLTLAATRHTLPPEDLPGRSRVNEIIAAAKAGRVPVHLVSNLSEKNPIEILPHNATLVVLLSIFARGTHRTLIQSAEKADEFIGIVSDHRLLSWFDSYARETPAFMKYLSNPIQFLSLPSINLRDTIVSAPSSASVLDAMKMMSEEGVSSVAVVEENNGTLLSAVSVTDIGKIVVPSQSNQILTTPLLQFIAQIKEPDGSTDGVDKYPVYSVFPSSLLSYTVEKLLATNAHRVFVTRESGPASPTGLSVFSGNLSGIVSIVDILSLFARLAKVPDIDPTRMQRHRRASSASSQSSFPDGDTIFRSRSNSRASVTRSPLLGASSPPGIPVLDSVLGSSLDPTNLQRKESRKGTRVKKDSI
ncbi:hypothetical protein CPB83DRAFT_853975 [Crepidotus variabilis]|uniref:CBS domain-containing protein n=1 Tax=Crepidotus variabilis TaxID=179855 RepID=A0A9P6EFJ9_9AGAR|nr:hypothetical protein CPB83DRAFT_853975 [Crepidotus variabilis]